MNHTDFGYHLYYFIFINSTKFLLYIPHFPFLVVVFINRVFLSEQSILLIFSKIALIRNLSLQFHFFVYQYIFYADSFNRSFHHIHFSTARFLVPPVLLCFLPFDLISAIFL